MTSSDNQEVPQVQQVSPEQQTQPAGEAKPPMISRKKLLASLGMATAAIAATSLAYRGSEASSASIPDDDVLVEQPFTGAIARTQHNKNEELVSVADFGGQGDGTTDDTAPLAAAMAALAAGGTVRQSGRIRYEHGFLPAVDILANDRDYAEIGTDEKLGNPAFAGSAAGWTLNGFSYSSNAVSHAAGSSGYVEQQAAIESYTTYLITVQAFTSSPGNIQLYMDGNPVLDSIQDYYLVAGSRTVKLGYFSLATNGTKPLRLATDTGWAGSISGISLIKIAHESEPALVHASADDMQLRIPNVMKFGRFNASNLAIGDRTTASTWLYESCWNIALGARAQQFNQIGFENVAVGAMALQYNYASRNSAYGYSAMRYNTSGEYNSGLGYKALILNTEGSYNTGVGFHAGFQNTVGNQNTSVGYQAMYNSLKDSYNTAIGSQAGLNCAGDANTFLGALSGFLDVGAVSYPFARSTSLGAETKGYGTETTLVGWNARIGTQTAAVTNSLAAGTWAIVESSYATAIGDRVNISSGGYRATAIGQSASAAAEEAVALGYNTAAAGAGMTAVGSRAGANHAGANATFVGYQAGSASSAVAYDNITCLGAGAAVTGSNQLQLGNSSVTSYAYGAVQNRSDARDKADIHDSPLGLDFIASLRPRRFRWDYREDYVQVQEDGQQKPLRQDGSKKRKRFHEGLIAQEVKAAMEHMNVDWGGYQDHKLHGGDDVLTLGYEELIGPLINAVKELKQEVEQLKAALASR